ncbi:hypothetical protein H4582DRAFT_250620 [Lactarius indigo]|nr:hypothetical protein H4582DRAFT_250620 [Lactarius indigo]
MRTMTPSHFGQTPRSRPHIPRLQSRQAPISLVCSWIRNLSASMSSHRSPRFPRVLGSLSVHRTSENATITVSTPSLMASSSRGVVPTFPVIIPEFQTRSDGCTLLSNPCECVPPTTTLDSARLPIGSLELSPPVPTFHPGPYPLHASLGFRPNRHILTLSLRDPADDRDMPPNGNSFVSALCLRGVRKVRIPAKLPLVSPHDSCPPSYGKCPTNGGSTFCRYNPTLSWHCPTSRSHPGHAHKGG